MISKSSDKNVNLRLGLSDLLILLGFCSPQSWPSQRRSGCAKLSSEEAKCFAKIYDFLNNNRVFTVTIVINIPLSITYNEMFSKPLL